ncbi:MAG: hypothetical protein K8R92_04575 [Planctomycetes bacterium]|nr:hypothetical protein [Planctomycetota bacterium]
MDAQALLDILSYKRQILEQFLTVSSIFGGFAVTGVIALRTDTNRDRVHTLAFGAMAVAAISFIFATALDAIWLPVSHMDKYKTAKATTIQTLLDTGEGVVWSVLIGAISLVIAIGLLGFSRSRSMGFFVLLITLFAISAYILHIRALFVSP